MTTKKRSFCSNERGMVNEGYDHRKRLELRYGWRLLFPLLTLPEENRSIGYWGGKHLEYIREHRPILFNQPALNGKLQTYLVDLNEQAHDRLELIMQQMKKTEGVIEAMKASDQMAWVRAMNSIRSRAEEIILHELIYGEDAL